MSCNIAARSTCHCIGLAIKGGLLYFDLACSCTCIQAIEVDIHYQVQVYMHVYLPVCTIVYTCTCMHNDIIVRTYSVQVSLP